MPTRVLLADDHPVWRRGVRDLLAAEPDLAVVAEAADGEEALAALRAGGVDVAVLDMEMPRVTGVEVARAVQAERLGARVLALSSYADPSYVTGLFQSGASGYLTKDQSPELVVEAVRAVARGEGRWFVSPAALADPAAGLSDRERDVLRLLAEGRANGQIAEALFVSENTVRSHLTSVYAKVGVGSAREAIVWAIRTGFADGGA
ncbi:response regulator transcription factor [Rubrivirga sp. S365]|uniref:response regulator transcription factor n=1 Tax=Rubrivirga sp. S365 TaxID=3076080 RepID=UPI0028C59768|nr:response regulator transcription factor [Rubrivirga sp. S365]MDT7858172.1 response regulator transcription factor [Rubrivirga sp. S365]